jgi:hypothetical protein
MRAAPHVHHVRQDPISDHRHAVNHVRQDPISDPHHVVNFIQKIILMIARKYTQLYHIFVLRTSENGCFANG